MLHGILQTRDSLRRGILSPGDAEEVLHLLMAATNASAAALATPMAWAGFNVSANVPSDWPRVYLPVRQWDPLLQRVCDPRVGGWVRGHDDLAHLHADNPCSQAFFGYGFVDCLGLRLRNIEGPDHCLALYRESGKPKFTLAERDALALLVPHLSAAFRTPTAQRALHGRPNWQHRLRHAVVLRYPERTAEWTPCASALVVRALPEITPRTWPKLERALFRAARSFYSDARQSAVPIVASIRADFAVVRPEYSPGRAPSPSGGLKSTSFSLIAVLSESAAGPVPQSARPFEELLSPRERRIGRLLARGERLEDAAESCGITRETAKHHLKSLYKKLQVSTRVELAQFYSK